MHQTQLIAVIQHVYEPVRGEWLVDTTYRVYDIVTHLDNTYDCLQLHVSATSNTPGTRGGRLYWHLQVPP
jgi:hypothetical protein